MLGALVHGRSQGLEGVKKHIAVAAFLSNDSGTAESCARGSSAALLALQEIGEARSRVTRQQNDLPPKIGPVKICPRFRLPGDS
jgi:hypothetical protein